MSANVKKSEMAKNIRIFTLILTAAVLLLSVSCKKDETLYYGNVTMGNFAGDKFISDQGNEFTIVENQTGGEIKDIKRAIMQCDVLQKTAGTQNGYDVRVSYVGEVLTKEPLTFDEAATDLEKTVEDPVLVEQVWISGGYLNMYIMFEVQVSPTLEESKHMVNLVYDPTSIGTGKLMFTLRHNSYGETLSRSEEEEDTNEGDTNENSVQPQSKELVQWGLAGAYVSFQLSEIITDKNAELTLQWKQHVINEYGWMAEVQDQSYKLTYSKDNFEHVPLALKSKTVRSFPID